MDRIQPSKGAEGASRSRSQDWDESYRQSEEELHLLVERVTEYAIFRLDPEGHVVSWNAGAERIKGYRRAEILGRHVSTFYTREDAEAGLPARALERAASEGKWKSEGWRVRKGGERFWASVTITALYGDEGALRGFAKVTRDMTERHEREEALTREKRRAERENALLELMQKVAATANDADHLDEAMREAVRAVCEHTGWPVGHVYRTDRQGNDRQGNEPRLVPTGIWHLEDGGRFETFRTVTDATTFAVGQSLPGRAAERGAPVWIRDVTADPNFPRARVAEDIGVKGAFGVPVRVEGEAVAVLEFFSAAAEEPDEKLLEAMASVGVQLSRVAERERAREALRRSERRYRRLFDSVQEGIVVQAGDRRVIDVNPAALEIFGYDRDELVGKEPTALFADLDLRRKRQKIIQEEGGFRAMEFELRRKDGQVITCEATATVERDAEGNPERFYTILRDVTERKQAEQALRESEEELRALVDASAQMLWKIDAEGHLVEGSLSWRAFTGQSVEELQDGGWSPVHPEDRAQAKVRWREAIENGTSFDSEHRVYHAESGRYRWMRARTVPLYDDDGAVRGWIGMNADIDEQRRAQEALKESEAKFRALAEQSPTGIAIGQDGVFKYANKRQAEIFGYEREEIIDTFPVEEVVHPDDRHIVRENLRRRIEGEVEAVHFQVRGWTKGGETIDIEVHGRRFTYEGRPAVIGSVLDITERKEAERALKESEELFRALAENAQVGIGLMQDGVMEYVNPAYGEIFGYEPEELIGEPPAKFIHPDDYAHVEEQVKKRIDKKRIEGREPTVQYEFKGRTKSGETRRVEVQGSRITYRGRPAVIGTLLDVTDRRRMQREVLRIQEEERRRLGQDLHDGVASQLTGIGIMLGVLARSEDLGEEPAHQISEIRELVDESCDDVRRLSRGLAPAGLSGKELPSALERLADNVEGGVFEKSFGLPEFESDVAAHLYWIAQEAVANAQRYAEADEIAVRLMREDSAVVLEVEDDGKGFDLKGVEQEGLGLRTMRYRGELLDATLTIDSDRGAGARVRCRLSG